MLDRKKPIVSTHLRSFGTYFHAVCSMNATKSGCILFLLCVEGFGIHSLVNQSRYISNNVLFHLLCVTRDSTTLIAAL
jgi:hypothetical protein